MDFMMRRQQGQMGSLRTSSIASSNRMVRIESGVCRSGRTGRAARDEVLGSRREAQQRFARADGGVFFGAAGKARAHQEAIGGDAQGSVVVKATPVAPLIVTEPEFLLQFLIVALDAPAQLDQTDQFFEGDTRRQRR